MPPAPRYRSGAYDCNDPDAQIHRVIVQPTLELLPSYFAARGKRSHPRFDAEWNCHEDSSCVKIYRQGENPNNTGFAAD